ncbi:MAG: zinc ribbon domain-containing protein [Promethearchaeota archaeon]
MTILGSYRQETTKPLTWLLTWVKIVISCLTSDLLELRDISFAQECIESILEQLEIKDPFPNICFLAYLLSNESESINSTYLSQISGIDKALVEKILSELQEVGILDKDFRFEYEYPSVSSNLSATYLSNLSKPERMILGLAKSMTHFPILEIERLLRIPPNSMWVRGTLCRLIREGIITGHFSDRDNFTLISSKKGTPHHRDFLSLPLRLIVGCLLCHETLKIDEISEKTGLEKELVFENLLELFARDSLGCQLKLNGSTKQEVLCQLISNSITGQVVHPADLVDILKNVAGIVILFPHLDLKKFSEMIGASVSEIRLALYLITVHTGLTPKIKKIDLDKEVVRLPNKFIEPRLREAEFSILQAFLLNKLEIEGHVNLKRLDMPVNLVFEELVTLVLNGVIQCHIEDFKVTLQNPVKPLDFDKEPQLLSSILGFLAKTPNFKLNDLKNTFSIDTAVLTRYLEDLESKSLVILERENQLFRVKKYESYFRALEQLTRLELVILGFFHMVRAISSKKAALLLGIPEKRLKNTLYSLIGSGWLHIRIRDTGKIIVSKRETLKRPTNPLSNYYQSLLNALSCGTIRIKDLSLAFSRNVYVLLWEICFLVSQGFIECRLLQRNYDSLEISQIHQIDQVKPHSLSCFACGYKILFQDKFCAHCGWKKRRCKVCQKLLEFDEKVKVCLYCGSLGHTEHMEEYVKVFKKCPACDSTIALSDLKDYYPPVKLRKTLNQA